MRYNNNIAAIELTVVELCLAAHKSGSIDARFPGRGREAAHKSGDAFRKLQKSEKGIYTPDYPVRNTVTRNGLTYSVEGCADGVVEENGRVIVEEIKIGRTMSRASGEDAFTKLRCYAHFICEAKHLPRIGMRMRVCATDTDKIKESYSEQTADELAAFYDGLLARIEPFARQAYLKTAQRLPSVEEIGFPYDVAREGQVELAEATYAAIRRGHRLFAEAPTGIGKTMSTLYPAVKAVGAGLVDRVFYLTARASTRREAYAAAGLLFQAGAKLRTVILYAKEQMCLCESGCRSGNVSHCNPLDCPYARGYYDRADAALFELLSRQNGFPRSILMEVARRHRVCPYELSLDLSEQCEIIICDYNYVFDPVAYLRRYFDPNVGERGQYVFLIDEAHNLPDRTRDMYSAELPLNVFESVYARIDPQSDSELEAMLGGFILVFHRLGKLCVENRQQHEDGSESGYYLNKAPFEKFHEQIGTLRRSLDAFLKKQPAHMLAPALGDLTAVLKRFSGICEYYDGRFLTYLENNRGHLCLRLICIDPAGVLAGCLGRARAAVLFSATLTPTDYFADILGGGKKAVSLTLRSPYDPDHLSITAVTHISTRMEDRDRSYKKIASMIAATISAKAGNYMVYFPSYDYLEAVHNAFSEKYPGVTCILQHRQMDLAGKEAFLAEFKADVGRLRVGFCVLGGSFSEGVDLPGSRLIGAIVVGVGIPGLSNERNLLRDYYENKCEQGYHYAYTFPGMNRVLQAAGRVIRTEEDRGVVVLIDSRYGEEPYLHLYPPHWQNICVAGDAKSLARRLQLFWEAQEN